MVVFDYLTLTDTHLPEALQYIIILTKAWKDNIFRFYDC